MDSKKKLWKYLLFPAIGFAIGGALWGWECYKVTGLTGESFANSLLFIPATIILGIIGGLGILFIKRGYHWETVVEFSIVGPVLWFVCLLIPIVFFWPIMIVGSIITPVFGIIQSITRVDIVPLIVISPSIYIGQSWFGFLIIGAIISWFYAFVLKIKAKPVIWRGALGATLSAFISPVLGNLIGNNLLHSLLSAYLINFTLIGLIFGLFLGWGIWKAENAKENI